MTFDQAAFDAMVEREAAALHARNRAEWKPNGKGNGHWKYHDPDPNGALLMQMNQKYAVVQIVGKTRVIWFEPDPACPGCQVPVFQTFDDFKKFHLNPK